MGSYIISERAKKDIIGIWDYTVREWSEEQAERYFNSLLDTCERIASSPENSGRDYEYVCPHLRGISCGRHIIFFRFISRNKVRIIRIMYERMDFPRHF